MLDARCANLNEVERGIEDRNRTAPFPFCGNRFEFRAVGSSQNCAFPMAMVNTAFADGLRALNELLEGGSNPRDAAAQLFEENKRVVFCGNGYSAEWPIEAKKRGLPNLKDAVEAHCAFHTEANVALFERMGVLSEAEVEARAECLLENYAAVLEIEARTLVAMVRTGIEPALEKDLNVYVKPSGTPTSIRLKKRMEAYDAVTVATDALEEVLTKVNDYQWSTGHSSTRISNYLRRTRFSLSLNEYSSTLHSSSFHFLLHSLMLTGALVRRLAWTGQVHVQGRQVQHAGGARGVRRRGAALRG